MSRQTLLKYGWFFSDNTEARVIDTNELVAKKLDQLKEQMLDEGAGSFSQGFQKDLDAGAVAELLTDDEGGQDGFSQGIPAKEIEDARQTADEIIAEAQAEAERMLVEAQAEAEGIKKSAFAHAQEDGRKSGYEAGMNQAMIQLQEEQDALEARRCEMEQSYKEQLEAMEPELIDVLTGIYEQIFQVDLSQRRSMVAHLAAKTIHQADGCKDFIVHVSKEEYEETKKQKEILVDACAASNATVEVIEDLALTAGECLIETDGGIYDCSLGVQLAELTAELKLLSYEKD